MKHSFQPTSDGLNKCRACRYTEIDHTEHATCESCGATATCNIYTYKNLSTILFCPTCYEKEVVAYSRTPAYAESVEKNAYQSLLAESEKVDSAINIQTDIFNAKTVSINALKLEIEKSGIENPHFELAKVLDARYKHLKDVIFSNRAQITDAENEQRAIQTHYNELAKKLRSEERTQLQLKDVNYKPSMPDLKKVKAPAVKQYDRDALVLWAGKLELEFPALKGLGLKTIQTLVVASNVKPEGAYNILKTMFLAKAAKGN